MTEPTAAIAHQQFLKLPEFNRIRLEMVEYLSERLSKYDCFGAPPGREGCLSTYYIYPLRYLQEHLGGWSRDEVISAINAEGIQFHQGYTTPLYMQPMYQRREAFKNGYPWSAPENRDSNPDYSEGSCPTCEFLNKEQIFVNEHIRPPHTLSDLDDIVAAVEKVVEAFSSGKGREKQSRATR
jgi:dTDP-4-amino-4,6-dideoxygalactose transaminase